MLSFLSPETCQTFSTYQGQGGKTPSVTAYKIFEATHHDEVDGFEPHSFTYNVFGKIHNTHCTIMSLKYRIKVINDVSLLIFFFKSIFHINILSKWFICIFLAIYKITNKK